jgi:hypothetical protein
MSHFTDRTLEGLITGSASPSEVQRLRRHVEGCRACARRLEEWRDNFAEVDERYPELAMDAGPLATMGSEGLVLLPSSASDRRFELDLTTALWIGAVLMAVLVGYGTYRLRSSREVVDATTLYPQLSAVPESRPADGMPALPAASEQDSLARRAAEAPPVATPKPPMLPVSPEFRLARPAEAARRLGGRVRTIRGLEPDHMEIGPASAVPNSLPGVPVIRVIYQTADGGRMVLDQQLIPVDSTGFRPIDDSSLEGGQVSYGSSPSGGITLATWLDDDGYRLSLAAQVPADSLRKLVSRVR